MLDIYRYNPPLPVHTMVEEANIFGTSSRLRLSDAVLKDHLTMLNLLSPKGGIFNQYILWLFKIFPEVESAERPPDPWVWTDLVEKVENIGGTEEASIKCRDWVDKGRQVAYWTGGLEFTQNHHAIYRFLKERGVYILLGVEPHCYPNEFGKGRGAITQDSVPISFWSKILGDEGFVFSIPRPLPSGEQFINSFYENLFFSITNHQASIVVSLHDPFKDRKCGRGSIVEVPSFSFPSTTELYESFFG